MKVYNNVYINRNQYTPQFKGNEDRTEGEWHEFGCVDPVNERTVFDYIRDKHWENTSQYYQLYNKECNRSPIEVRAMIDDLLKYYIPVNGQFFEYNSKLNKVEENVFRGPMVIQEKHFELLKSHGIQRLIETNGHFSDREALCKKYGIKYTAFNFRGDNIDNIQAFKTKEEVIETTKRLCAVQGKNEKETEKIIKNQVKFWEQESRKFIDNFTDFIYAMQNENVYIGCEAGKYNTNRALYFDYYFNPNKTHPNYYSFSNPE
ncbi:MAG: hypothetical protein IJ583_13855, partial [Firmicutes bacterium]|nr:hypothetical protein [Bacillota bacterium]